MRNVTGKVVSLFVFMVAPALAQNHFATQAPPAANGPAYDVGIGYSYVQMGFPAVGHASLRGVDISGNVAFRRRWGATLDSNFARTPNVLGTGHMGYLLTLHGGPVFYPVSYGDTRMFVHLLGGAAVVDGAVPITTTSYFHGWQSRFSYAAGGGIERSVVGPLAVRVKAEYLRTAFYNAAGTVLPQDNFRVTAGLVFRLNDRPHRAAGR